jgi:hypothetical protein
LRESNWWAGRYSYYCSQNGNYKPL